MNLQEFRQFFENPTADAGAPAPDEEDGPTRSSTQFARPGAKPVRNDGGSHLSADSISFARHLLRRLLGAEPSGWPRDKVLKADHRALQYLPEKVHYIAPSDNGRDFHTLIIEFDSTGRELLQESKRLFPQAAKLDLIEDALDRFGQAALKGFAKYEQKAFADKRGEYVPVGRPEQTMIVLSVRDDRASDERIAHLVHFVRQGEDAQGSSEIDHPPMESFSVRQEAVTWEPQLKQDYTLQLFHRFVAPLQEGKWSQAFAREEERREARKLLDVLSGQATEESFEDVITNLLEEIALSFGLEADDHQARVTRRHLLSDHDIGIDPDRNLPDGFENPLKGFLIHDVANRLLGYIVYLPQNGEDADTLRDRLQKYNRFHNVLVIYPTTDQKDETSLEVGLWQGDRELRGKLLKKGANYIGPARLISMLSRFFMVSRAEVENQTELAQELAYRARYLRRLAIRQLKAEKEDGPMCKLYEAFTAALIHNQTEEEFADAYAQTLAYGLLSARWISKDQFQVSGDRFTRETALDHMPTTSPFLRSFFQTVLQENFDPKQKWLLEDIANFLDRIQIEQIFGHKDGEPTISTDPVIHFYEPFLQEYDPVTRKERGVYYTPDPLVHHIVESVNQHLKENLHLPLGLADTTTWAEYVERHPKISIPPVADPDSPLVQILDPAAGTGTFLKHVIEVIHHEFCTASKDTTKKLEADSWSQYVEDSLLPRLHGFELMVAPYAVCHIKLALTLQATGYEPTDDSRINVFLTNALEAPLTSTPQLDWTRIVNLTDESREASKVKGETALTVIVGNPPYSRSTKNKNPHIDALVAAYKDPVRAHEGNIQPLDDDYIKFWRIAEHWIELTNLGIAALVSNNTFYSGRIHRGIRRHHLDTFDFIDCLDLQETGKLTTATTDGVQPDDNVFPPITEATSVTLAVKTGGDSSRTSVHYRAITGTREAKYSLLRSNVDGVTSFDLDLRAPYWLFIPRDEDYVANHEEVYESFVKLDDLFKFSNVAGKPGKDSLLISYNREDVIPKLAAHRQKIERQKLKAAQEDKELNLTEAERNLAEYPVDYQFDPAKVVEYAYRPFDLRWTYYDNNLWTRGVTALHGHIGRGPVLLASKIIRDQSFAHAFISETFMDVIFLSPSRGTNCYAFPLHLAKEGGDQSREKACNLSQDDIVPSSWNVPALDCLHYIYAVLHSPTYREAYFEALKLDFPRIPPALRKDLFEELVILGEHLFVLHLGKTAPPTTKARFKHGKSLLVTERNKYIQEGEGMGRLYINDSTYIADVSKEVWEFHVGGHQVLSRWLYYRKRDDRELTAGDTDHLIDVISRIEETIALMDRVDDVVAAYGGLPSAFLRTQFSD